MNDPILKLWESVRYFKVEEFDDPTEPGSGSRMNIEFVKVLDQIRMDSGFAFSITSGYRSVINNIAVGGKKDSAHMDGRAVDISCPTSGQRLDIIAAALKNGIKRIGIGTNFVHLDMSLTLPHGVIWLYPEKATATSQRV